MSSTYQESPREDDVGEGGAESHHHDLAEEHQEVGYAGQDGKPRHVPQEEEEGVLGGGAEVLARHGAHDVGVAVEKFHELLEAPETAFTATHDALHHHVVLVVLGQLLLHLL